MERDPEESSWIEARWLDRPGSAITIPECRYPRGGQPRLIPSKLYIYINRHRIVAHLSPIARGSRLSRFGPSFGIRIVISKPCHFPVSSHCFTLFEICKRIKGFPGGSQRSSTHEPCSLRDKCNARYVS